MYQLIYSTAPLLSFHDQWTTGVHAPSRTLVTFSGTQLLIDGYAGGLLTRPYRIKKSVRPPEFCRKSCMINNFFFFTRPNGMFFFPNWNFDDRIPIDVIKHSAELLQLYLSFWGIMPLLVAHEVNLRGAWRDHRFPEPFSWFLHETGLQSLKITSARCFLLKCQRKVSKKAKEHRRFRGVLRRWRSAAIDRTTFHACQRCRKTAVFAVFSRLWVSLARKSLSWPAMSVPNKKQEFEQRKRIKLFDDFWVRAYRFDFAPRRRPRARSI